MKFLALLFASLLPALPAAAATTPAISLFDQAFAKVNTYTVTIREYEAKGNSMQERTYNFWFKRPNFIKTLIVSGPGAGSGAVWTGGDTMTGHQGGAFSFIQQTISVTDPRATSLRGHTIPQGTVQNQVDRFKEIHGTLTQHPGPMVDGMRTEEVDLKIADPASNDDVTRAIMYFSPTTHFPLRQIQYDGNKIVDYVWFMNLRTNVNLTATDF